MLCAVYACKMLISVMGAQEGIPLTTDGTSLFKQKYTGVINQKVGEVFKISDAQSIETLLPHPGSVTAEDTQARCLCHLYGFDIRFGKCS